MVIIMMVFFRQRKILLLQGHGQNPKTACSLAHYHEGDQEKTTGASTLHKIQLKVGRLVRVKPGIPEGCVRCYSNESPLSPFLPLTLSLSGSVFYGELQGAQRIYWLSCNELH